MNIGRAFFSGCIAVFLMAGCATPLFKPEPPEQVVARLAEARWQALLAGDLEKAYSFEASSYREVVSFERFRARNGSAVNRQGIEVVSVECAEERCNVTVRVDFILPLRPRDGVQSTHLIERWFLENGDWRIYRQPR